MASLQHLCICALILTIIACHELLSVEGRKVKALKKQDFISAETKRVAKNHENSIKIAPKKVVFPPVMLVEADTDGFRPTPSGNSPGIGHKKYNLNLSPFVGLKDNAKAKPQGNAASATYSSTGSVDDFRPTAPGHSPGVGHSFTTRIVGPKA